MALSILPFLSPPKIPHHYSSLPFSKPRALPIPNPKNPLTIRCSASPASSLGRPKLVRHRPLDNAAARANRLRFVRKLLTLLLSKPRHFLPFRILSRRCRRYLAIPPSRPLLPFVLRYPTLFRLFHSPSLSPSSPSSFHLCVGLTPAALSLSSAHLSSIPSLVAKLHRLLMLSPHRRLLLSKLVHLAPDLGLPPDFRSSICPRHPDKFTIVDTSYGRALQLASWDDSLATPMPPVHADSGASERIIDRPRKFPHLPLRRGLNLRRGHREYLLRLNALPEMSPFGSYDDGGGGEMSVEMAEKRACAVVREVLGMTVEKRTLVDHLTHFRKDFRLPNRLRAMLVRHPEMFYVSPKGVRHSVFLVEAYDDHGRLVVKDELLAGRERLEELVREGKQIRRARRKGLPVDGEDAEEEEEEELDVQESDEFDDLFEAHIGEDWDVTIGEEGMEDADRELEEVEEFWVKKAASEGLIGSEHGGELEVW